VTLPAFATERRAAAPLLLGAPAADTQRRRRQLSIDIFCPQDAQQQTRWPPLLLSNDGTDRQTDGQMPDRYTCPARHTMLIASIREGQTGLKIVNISTANVTI